MFAYWLGQDFLELMQLEEDTLFQAVFLQQTWEAFRYWALL